jgi:molybdenum cofactor cytidylyltransferase
MAKTPPKQSTNNPGGVEGIILAAGLSTRSGRYKMALPLGDKTVIQRSVENMYDAVDRIWVVTGWQVEQVRALLAPYAKVEFALNKDYRRGMFSSVKTGLARTSAARVFLQPGDCAFISPAVYEQMLHIDAEIVIPTYGGRKGHPVLLDRSTIPEILALPDDGILRDYIQTKGFTPLAVEEDGILLDVDTPEDYEMLRAHYHSG